MPRTVAILFVSVEDGNGGCFNAVDKVFENMALAYQYIWADDEKRKRQHRALMPYEVEEWTVE